MDYNEYDKIQLDLTSIGDDLRSDLNAILTQSSADEETKELVKKTYIRISKSLDELAIIISRAAQLLTK